MASPRDENASQTLAIYVATPQQGQEKGTTARQTDLHVYSITVLLYKLTSITLVQVASPTLAFAQQW